MEGVSPNLTRFTRPVSLAGAQILSPLCLPIPPQRRGEASVAHDSLFLERCQDGKEEGRGRFRGRKGGRIFS